VCELLPVDFFAVVLDLEDVDDFGLLLLEATVFRGAELDEVVVLGGVWLAALKAYGSASAGATGVS
jgi:hypothetical protein